MKDLLIEHIKIDLQEEYGHLPMLHKYAEAFANALPKQFSSNETFYIDETAFKSIKDRFFNKISISVHVLRSENPFTHDNSVSYYQASNNDKIDPNGKLNDIKIALNAIVHNSNDIIMTLVMRFEHELTHAYETYVKLSQGKDNISLNNLAVANGQNLRDEFNPQKPVERAVCSFLYITSSYEVNANIGAIESELRGHEEELKNPEKIAQVIKSTNAYKEYHAAYGFIKFLYGIKNNPVNDYTKPIQKKFQIMN